MHWQRLSIEELLKINGVTFSLAIFDADYVQPSTRTSLAKIFIEFRKLGWSSAQWRQAYREWCRGFFKFYRAKIARPPSNKIVPINDLLENVPQLRCHTIRRGRWSQYFRDDDLERIRDHRLDFILRYGFGIVRGEILNAARFGIWSFHHDDERKYRGFPPCFWEVYNGDPITGAILQRINEKLDSGTVIRRGSIDTVQHSYATNLSKIYLKSASWPAEVCLDIQAGKTNHLDAAPSQTDAPIFHAPTLSQFLTFTTIMSYRRLRRVLFSQ